MARQKINMSGGLNRTTAYLVVAVMGVVFFGLLIQNSSNSVTGLAGQGKGNDKFADPTVETSNAKGSDKVNGQHYNLNIIGAKNVGDIGDSKGHTMFVALNGRTKIMMTQDLGGEFLVTDRNGLDGAASFNIAPGKYNIYARALGKPGGKLKIDAWGEFEDALEGTQLLLLGYVNIERTKGKPKSVNINELFYVDVTLCLEVDQETGECSKTVIYTDYWVFDIEELLNYWWEYNNNGLKLLQVRFYQCTLDPTGQAGDYCRWADGSPIVSSKTIIDA